jgi:hypothetical protein
MPRPIPAALDCGPRLYCICATQFGVSAPTVSHILDTYLATQPEESQ